MKKTTRKVKAKTTLGTVIKQARLRKGLTQVQVERASGLIPKFLTRVENDRQCPTLAQASRICKAVGVSISRAEKALG